MNSRSDKKFRLERALKLLVIILAGLLVQIPAFGGENPKIVRVGAFNYFPGIFLDKDGTVKGFYVDALAEIEQKENIKFEYVYGSWSEGLARIKSGEVDLITSVAHTAERARYLDYAREPLLTVWGELYVALGSEIDSILGIDRKKIAIMKDDFNALYFKDMVKKFGVTCEFEEVPGFEEVFKKVADGSADAGVVNSTFGTPKQFEYRLRPTGIVFNPFDIYFAVGKGKNGELLHLLERYLSAWRHQENSVYNAARQKWAHGDIGITRVIPEWIGYAILALIALIIVSITFIFLLRKRVRQATSSIMRQQTIFRENQALLSASIESPKDMIILAIDPEYKYLCYNSAHESVMARAYGKNIAIGANLLDCISDGSDKAKAKINYDKALRGESHLTVEEYGEEGRDRSYYETRYNPVMLDGKIIGATAFSANVSERVKMLDRLKESEEKYKTLSDISIDAIFVNQDSRIVYLNPAALALFGAERAEQLLGKSPIEFFHPDYRELVAERIERMLKSGEPVPLVEEKIMRLDGSALDVEVAAIPFTHGRERSIQVILRDITERKRAEREIRNFNATLQNKIEERTEELEKANLALESFSNSVSHDLRAPLRAISGYSELLEENCAASLDDEGHRLLSTIKANTRKMEDIIRGLLNLSRAKNGDLQYSNIDMAGLMSAKLSEVSDSEVINSFEIVANALPDAWGDETLLGQVWFNLLSNAVKYSLKSSARKIEIGARPEDGKITYYVKDSGVGFDPRHAEKLFGTFQRLHSSSEFEGVGIGLSIVRHVVERHGGSVWAEGKVGEGACFYFALPVRESESPESLGE